VNADEAHVATTAVMRDEHVDNLALIDGDPMPGDRCRTGDGNGASGVLPRRHYPLPVC
jgi:hypothetical protein